MPKTNCGQVVEVDCIDCYKEVQTWCMPCQNKILKAKIHLLEAELAYLKNDYDQQFEIEPWLIHKYIKTFTTPQSQHFSLNDSCYFYTITFDPSRFKNLGLHHYKEERYIKHQLARLVQTEDIKKLYGSFELTNSGVTHAHVIIQTYNPIEVLQKLKREFTFNPNNNLAVMRGNKKDRVGLATINSTKYIDKIEDGKGTENKTWFVKYLDIDIEEEYELYYAP